MCGVGLFCWSTWIFALFAQNAALDFCIEGNHKTQDCALRLPLRKSKTNCRSKHLRLFEFKFLKVGLKILLQRVYFVLERCLQNSNLLKVSPTQVGKLQESRLWSCSNPKFICSRWESSLLSRSTTVRSQGSQGTDQQRQTGQILHSLCRLEQELGRVGTRESSP